MRRSFAPRRVIVALLLVYASAPGPGPAAGAASLAGPVTPEQRLAGQFIRAVHYLLAINPVTVEAVDGSVVLVNEATKLDPENPETWRVALEVAGLAERDEMRRRVLERLVELDPDDEVARLQWISLQLDAHQTVEDRVAAYESWLMPEKRQSIGPAARSRLALDLALLERRRGNIGAFSDRLAEAVTLDPANRAAAAIAAGYFRVNVDDPYAEAELLVTLFLADPTDVAQQAVLGAHLLDHGAYKGAERLYSLAMESYTAAGLRAPSDLIADVAIARWAHGDLPGAMRAISAHQSALDALHRARLREERPEMTPLERAREYAPMSPTLATVAAALQNIIGQSNSEYAVTRVIDAYRRRIEQIRGAEDTAPEQKDADVAATHLELALVILWLGGEIDRAREALTAATEIQPISEAAQARFDGWIALRAGDFEGAAALLQPHAETDAIAQLGLAVARHELGRTRDAARQYLDIARQQPGTLMGVWAADRLAALLGQRVPLTDMARRFEQLIDQIHPSIDRFPTEPRSAVSIRVTPTKPTYGPYEPLLVDVEISNNSLIPLSIDRQGSIRPEVALLPSVQIARQGGSGNLPPVIVGIDRRLRLMPRERLTIRVDLRRTHVGTVLESSPIPGAMVSARAVLNFTATQQRAIIVGMLGSEHESSLMRVDGVRITQDWIEESLAAVVREDGSPDLARMALLSQLAGSEPSPRTTEEQRRLISGARTVIAERYARLDPASQAWLLTVIPDVSALEATHAIARKSEHRLVRITQLVFHITESNDPMLDAAARSDDPALQTLATMMRQILSRATAESDTGAPLAPPITPGSGERGPGG